MHSARSDPCFTCFFHDNFSEQELARYSSSPSLLSSPSSLMSESEGIVSGTPRLEVKL